VLDGLVECFDHGLRHLPRVLLFDLLVSLVSQLPQFVYLALVLLIAGVALGCLAGDPVEVRVYQVAVTLSLEF